MSIEVSPATRAQADQEVAERTDRLHDLMAIYKETIAEGFDRTTAIAALTGGFVQGFLGGGCVSSISAMLAVAIAELVERDSLAAAKVLGRSVTCTFGCHNGNNDFDCPVHGGMQGGGLDV